MLGIQGQRLGNDFPSVPPAPIPNVEADRDSASPWRDAVPTVHPATLGFAFNFPSWGHAQSELPLCMILQQLRGIPDLPGVRCCSHQEVVLLLSTSAQGTCMRV